MAYMLFTSRNESTLQCFHIFIPQTILQCITVIHDYMSAYNKYYVTYCLFITMFMLSFSQLQGVDCHLFHHDNYK